MAKICEMEPGFEDWVKELPEQVREVVATKPPNLLYKLKDTDQRVYILSYSNDKTVRVAITGQYNKTLFERDVFGINPDDLEECDLPGKDEELGVTLDADQTEDLCGVLAVLAHTDRSIH